MAEQRLHVKRVEIKVHIICEDGDSIDVMCVTGPELTALEDRNHGLYNAMLSVMQASDTTFEGADVPIGVFFGLTTDRILKTGLN